MNHKDWEDKPRKVDAMYGHEPYDYLESKEVDTAGDAFIRGGGYERDQIQGVG